MSTLSVLTANWPGNLVYITIFVLVAAYTYWKLPQGQLWLGIPAVLALLVSVLSLPDKNIVLAAIVTGAVSGAWARAISHLHQSRPKMAVAINIVICATATVFGAPHMMMQTAALILLLTIVLIVVFVWVVPALYRQSTRKGLLANIIIVIAAILFGPFAMPSVAPWLGFSQVCRIQAESDQAVIELLVHTETAAANHEDLSLIRDIFAPDATIHNVSTGETWNDPVAHYRSLFAETDFENAKHSTIHGSVGTSGTVASYSSASSGDYSTKDGKSHHYDNPPGSDHWILHKNSTGCWVITEFTFR